MADVWFMTAADARGPWRERHVAGPFDVLTIPDHIGLYQGIAGVPGGFVSAYTVGTPLSLIGATLGVTATEGLPTSSSLDSTRRARSSINADAGIRRRAAHEGALDMTGSNAVTSRDTLSPDLRTLILVVVATVAMLAPAGVVRADGVYEGRSISGESPFPIGCEVVSRATNDRDTETQPHLAVNPTNRRNMVVTWAQDSSAGIVVGVTHDGGKTWTNSIPPETSFCTGGTHHSAYKTRVAFNSHGRLFLSSEGKNLDAGSRATVHVSDDDGTSWSPPVTLEENTFVNLLSWPSLATDPIEPRRAYAAWYRYVWSEPPDRAPGLEMRFARTLDGGETWLSPEDLSPAAPEGYDRAMPQLVVLPGGTLVNIFLQVPDYSIDDSEPSTATVMAARSTDQGRSWSEPVEVARRDVPGNPDDMRLRRLAIGKDGIHDLLSLPAVGRDGTIYYAWPDIAADNSSTIYLTTSSDGGRTWTAPAAVRESNVPMAATNVAVADDGTVGILFYDFRHDAEVSDNVATTDVWLLTAPAKGLGPWVERHIAGRFDAFTVPHNIGWNQGFVGGDGEFLAAYTLGKPLSTLGPTDIFFARLPLPSQRTLGRLNGREGMP